MRSPLVLIAFAAACSGGDPAAGGERAACRSDGTCEIGLECWSEVCVRPPSADCRAVAARLGAVKLGNYATPEERRPVLAALRAQCEHERLTAREGQCLVVAPDDDALAECPRALLPELDGVRRRCTPLGPQVLALVSDGGPLAGAAQEASALIVDTCIADAWPKPVTSCALAATTLDAARACADALPRAARRSLERKLERLAGRAGRTRVPPPDPWASPPTTGLPPSCDRYIAMLEAYGRCPQVPADARNAIRQAVTQMRTSWGQTPAASRDAIDGACKQGLDAMRQGMAALGCATP